jgi:hypothetical protein
VAVEPDVSVGRDETLAADLATVALWEDGALTTFGEVEMADRSATALA